MRRTRTIVATARALLPLVTVPLLLAACGSDDGSSTAASTRPTTPRTVSNPTADAELTRDLGPIAAQLTKAGCRFGTFAEEEPKHVDDADELHWKTFPPTSGTHYPVWAPFGRYDEPVDDGYAVHNLEHGGVAVWLGSGSSDDVRDAVADLLDDDEKWLVAPRNDLTGVASVAWTKLLYCPQPAVDTLGGSGLAAALDHWYDVVVSTGSEAEKDVPAYAGGMKEPTPVRDISEDSPF